MRRIFAVGDIHGCLDRFLNILSQIDLHKEDQFYLLGDMIDRGSDSFGVINNILKLQRDGYDIQPIMGNHENMLLACLDAEEGTEDLELWLENGGIETLESYGVGTPDEIPMEHLNFIVDLPFYIMTDKFIFVHGSLNMKLKDPLADEGRETMIWGRNRITSTRKIGNRTVVSGHTILPLEEIKKTLHTKHIQLDNGCFLKGRAGFCNLFCLELESMELFIA